MQSFALLLLPLSAWAGPSTTEPLQISTAGPVGMQLHSWNDLRLWPMLFRKGVRYFKVDPNWSGSTSFCKGQTRVRNGTDARGCLILNHNNPSVLASRPDYNSSTDLLSLLGDPLHRAVLTAPGIARRVYIALCWKSVPGTPTLAGCQPGSTAVAHWVSLVDDFFHDANALVTALALNVEFVMDSGVPHACHLQRWRPWVSTDGPARAFTSNNATLGYAAPCSLLQARHHPPRLALPTTLTSSSSALPRFEGTIATKC